MKVKILDDFLRKDHLQTIQNIKLERIDSRSVKVYHHAIDKENNIISNDLFNDNFLYDLQKTYHLKALEILNELYPEKTKLYDYSDFHLIETGKYYKFPIHDDIPEKLLSGVIYINPTENTGTIFYDNKKGDRKSEVEWKINRAVFFSRKERKSWHSYQGDNKNNRVALVYNLMTKRIKQVYDVENKSYSLARVRSKLNIYLYKYFNFLI